MKLLKGEYPVHAFVSPMDVLLNYYLKMKKNIPSKAFALEGINYMRFTVAS